MDDVNLKILACNLRRALVAPEECDIPWMLETAAREMDRLRIAAPAADELSRLRAENDRLKTAIREHKNQRGDDRCWLDDIKLYHTLGEGMSPSMGLPPKCEFLESCSRYWEQRQWPVDKNRRHEPSEMTIAQLQAEVERLKTAILQHQSKAPARWAGVGIECNESGSSSGLTITSSGTSE